MSSLLRLVFGLMIACVSFFAVSATAQDATTSTQPAATSTQSTDMMNVQTTTTTTKVHKKSMHAMVDLNSADAKALAKIRGIGKKKAAAIVVYRTKNGSFKSVDDLSSVTNAKGKPLFSSKTIMHLKKRIAVGASS